jgi:mono/diheme cytochrome c family protein
MNTSKSKCLLFAIFITLFTFRVYAYDVAPIDMANADHKAKVEEGQKLFKANCAACHKVDQKLTGPALRDVWTRWESQEKIIKWVQNSSALIKSGDAYANKVFNDNGKVPMQPFPALSNDQVVSIIEYYIQAEQSGKLSAAAAPATGATTVAETAPTGLPWYIWVLVGVLAFAAVALYRLSNNLDSLVREAKGADLPKDSSILRFFNKKAASIATILIIATIGYLTARGAIDLGRSKDYTPEQPIKFSHKLHVGQNKIDCQFCHYGAEKSRHAVIPTTSVCMNCHRYVSTGPKYGTREIAKIYKASGWDPDKAAFVNKAEPIKWVKIHNLPDHVYFNHSQHVKVGGIDCKTCHGKVEEYEDMKQFAPLSMGWCINCHRQTEVKFKDNNYYSIFEKYHEEIKNHKRDKVTVENIGGTECQKCHY